MNAKVEAYLAEKEREQAAEKLAYRQKTLLKAGLAEKVFSPTGQASKEYPHYDADELRYYKLICEEVTDEEFARIEAYAAEEAAVPEEGKMFASIGEKIRSVAMILCWIGISFSVLAGLILMAQDSDLVPMGILTAGVGALLSWVSSLFLYGFGELIVKATQIEKNTRK